jgi:hypothetical protein
MKIEVGETYEIRREGQLQDTSVVKEVTKFVIVMENGQKFARATGTEFSTNKLPKPSYLSRRVSKKAANPLRLVK